MSPETAEGEGEPVKASSCQRLAAKQTHSSSVGSTPKQLKIDDANKGAEKSDGEEDKENGDGLGAGRGDGGTPKGPAVAEEDKEGLIAKAETLDEEFPGATAQGNLIFWCISHRR